MSTKGRVALIGSILALLVLVSRAFGILTVTYHEIRPYATKDTEVVMAGWQYDRASSELRDINEKIRRLEQKKATLQADTKESPQGKELAKDDAYFLDRLYRDKKKAENVLQFIDQTQMPYAK